MTRVVVVGGGYAGIQAVRDLAKHSDIEVLLLDKHSYHNLQPEVYDFVANKTDVADMTVDLITLCNAVGDNVTFLNRRVENVDFEKKIVHTEEREDIHYDYLMITVGARTFFPKQIEGLDKTDDIKKLHKALSFKQRFEREMFIKFDMEARKCEELSIVVVGAGLSGVEIAAEMAYYSDYIFKKGSFACDYLNIYLVNSGERILPGLDSYLVEKAEERLKSLGVKIISGKLMSKADKEYVYLNDGTQIRYSFTIFAGGIEAANLTNKLSVEKRRNGQLVTDEYLQVVGVKDVFAAGDCTECLDEKGNRLPPSVRIATQTASNAIKNIINLKNCRPLERSSAKSPGTLVALGGRYAAGVMYTPVGTIRLTGFIAWLAKHLVFSMYKSPLQKISRKGYNKLYKDLELSSIKKDLKDNKDYQEVTAHQGENI